MIASEVRDEQSDELRLVVSYNVYPIKQAISGPRIGWTHTWSVSVGNRGTKVGR